MPTKRDRLAVRLFKVIEGEAEGAFAITVFLVIVLAAIGLTALRIYTWQ